MLHSQFSLYVLIAYISDDQKIKNFFPSFWFISRKVSNFLEIKHAPIHLIKLENVIKL